MGGHICEILDTSEEYSSVLSTVLLKKYGLKHVWQKCCSVSEKNPRCNTYIHSMAAVAAERKRQANVEYWWIIHPFSYVRFILDIFITVVYLITFLTIPFMICFVVMDFQEVRLDNINLPIYVLCWLHIACNCVTGHHDKENMRAELHPAKIFKHYLRTFLLLDVLSSLPYDHITLPWRRVPGVDSYHIIVLLNLLPLLKLTRYYTINSNIYQLFTYFEIKNFYYELFTTALLGFFLMFWLSCLCHLVPILVMHFLNISFTECENCWIYAIRSDSLASRFQHALFIVLESLSATGYGWIVPKTDGHIILLSILMVVGRLMHCYIIVMFLQIKAGSQASESKFQEIINQLLAYARQKQLPIHMRRRLLAYYQHRFKNSYFREKYILANLSEQLRQEIALQSCRRLVENVAIFQNLPKAALQSIVKNVKFELYLPNDVIVKSGAHGDCMFFLSAGSVAVLTPTGKEVPEVKIGTYCGNSCNYTTTSLRTTICHLDDGAHFGEVALLLPDQRRVASVVAIEVCEVYRLDRKDFRKCIAVHSKLFATIERIATERIERAVIVEEQHKRHLMHGGYGHYNEPKSNE